jgi:thiamine-phosphate pyrophosphorylase
MQQQRLIAVSDRKSLSEIGLIEWATRLARAGIGAIQLREKDVQDRELINIAIRLRSEMPPSMQLYINGRPDIAALCGADGVHLPAEGLPTEPVHERYRSALRIGRSAHSLREVIAAHDEGADYVFLGPIFDTPAKRRYGPPLGLRVLEQAAQVGIPVIAIGGISSDRIESIASAGAAGAAGIRVFQDPVRTAELATAVLRHFKYSVSSTHPRTP